MSNIIPFDFHGHAVAFNGGGWINATQAAKQFGRLPNEWLRLPETIEYLKAMARTCGEIPYVKTSRARMDRGGGTWIHPKLAVAFARWLSADFAVWCDLQIDTLLHGDLGIRQEYEVACRALDDRKNLASAQGKGLSAWRWQKPVLEHRVEHLLEQLPLTLALDAA